LYKYALPKLIAVVKETQMYLVYLAINKVGKTKAET